MNTISPKPRLSECLSPDCAQVRMRVLADLDAPNRSVADMEQTHLEQCADCRAFVNLAEQALTSAKQPLPEVPPRLNRAVLAYANQHLDRRRGKATALKFAGLLRLAAMLVLLAALAVPAVHEWSDIRSGQRRQAANRPKPAEAGEWGDGKLVDGLAISEAEAGWLVAVSHPSHDEATSVAEAIEDDMLSLQAEMYFLAAALE